MSLFVNTTWIHKILQYYAVSTFFLPFLINDNVQVVFFSDTWKSNYSVDISLLWIKLMFINVVFNVIIMFPLPGCLPVSHGVCLPLQDRLSFLTPPPFPPPPMWMFGGKESDGSPGTDSTSSMLMLWYLCGFHTGSFMVSSRLLDSIKSSLEMNMN